MLSTMFTYLHDPILSIASADMGGAPDVLGAVRDLCLKTFRSLAAISCSKLFQSMVVLGKKEYL